jgi:hypothetical protein
MKDALAPVVQTSLELHFGRLISIAPDEADRPTLVAAAASLVRHISGHLLKTAEGSDIDASVLRYVLEKNKALPAWLINKGLIHCNNNLCNLEASIVEILSNRFNRRRLLDHLSTELMRHCWEWSDIYEKKRFPVKQINLIRKNEYYATLVKQEYIVNIGNTIINKTVKSDASYLWYIQSIGTLTLLDLVTPSIYEYTANLLESKYKTSFILDVFKDLFKTTRKKPVLDHFGVLIMGETPAAFALSDFQNDLRTTASKTVPHDYGVLELLHALVRRFDDRRACGAPTARFRLGGDPPQSLTAKVGAAFWLRRTLDAVKVIQQQKAVPTRGLQVEERTVLAAALEQKSILYFRLFDDPNDSAINPCQVKGLGAHSMVLQSPLGNRINEARSGQEVHGYFSVALSSQKSTYCDFRSNVTSVTAAGDHFLVKISIPATFELTRRTHKRLPLEPSQLGLFELSAPAPGVDWSPFGSLEKWPAPLCVIPDSASHCHVKDLSAGGLMLEIHHDAPAYDFFIERNTDEPFLAQMYLVGRINVPDLKLALRLVAKRIRDVPQLQKKFVGFQFLEAGEIRQDRFVRFSPVGSDGIFLINDWIFRNSIV